MITFVMSPSWVLVTGTKKQSTHSECDSLDNNEGFDLDNSASATNLDNM